MQVAIVSCRSNFTGDEHVLACSSADRVDDTIGPRTLARPCRVPGHAAWRMARAAAGRQRPDAGLRFAARHRRGARRSRERDPPRPRAAALVVTAGGLVGHELRRQTRGGRPSGETRQLSDSASVPVTGGLLAKQEAWPSAAPTRRRNGAAVGHALRQIPIAEIALNHTK